LVCLSRDYVRCVVFKPDNPNIVVSGSNDKTIKTWDITSGSCLSTLNVDGEVESVRWSPCGTKIAAACNDYDTDNYCVKILNSETGALLCALRGHSAYVNSVCFSSDGKQLTSGSDDTTVRNWDLATRASLS